MTTIKQDKTLGETLICHTLPSGLHCYIIPKKGYTETEAVICTQYGSIDNRFKTDGRWIDMPPGVAHFMEHKMFEDEEGGNIFEQFMKQWADCNAFTNFTATAYYFKATACFAENLRTLLSFTAKPYFTEQNVEKEKGIIAQEIAMYDDDPQWIVYFNLLKGLFHQHPIRENIAGTKESIYRITKDDLYGCYNTFYAPHNMALIVSGHVDEREVFAIAEEMIPPRPSPPQEIPRDYRDEPKTVAQKEIVTKMSVAMPLFHLGFKERDFKTPYPARNAAAKVLLDILAGESSPLYQAMYNEGLIDGRYETDYTGGLTFGLSIFGGFSREPEAVRHRILTEARRLREEGITDETFLRIKRKHIGRLIKGFNAIDAVCAGQVDYFTKNTDLIEIFKGYYHLEKNDIIKRLNEHLIEETMVMSVVMPS